MTRAFQPVQVVRPLGWKARVTLILRDWRSKRLPMIVHHLHQKKGAYRRNGVREYLVWITGEKRIVWWELHDGEYREISADADGVLKSRVFPGLWLDAAALLRGDLKKFRAVARAGIKSRAHAKFLKR